MAGFGLSLITSVSPWTPALEFLERSLHASGVWEKSWKREMEARSEMPRFRLGWGSGSGEEHRAETFCPQCLSFTLLPVSSPRAH